MLERMHRHAYRGEGWVPRTVSFGSLETYLSGKKCVFSDDKRSQSVPHTLHPTTHMLCLPSGTSAFRSCEQPLQFEIFHQLGQDPVRYDLTGWLHRAKPNLSALDAPQVLQQSKR